jgi:hypothetical protein
MAEAYIQTVAQVKPFLAAALATYGVDVLSQKQVVTADQKAILGRRILQVTWKHCTESNRPLLVNALVAAVDDLEDEDSSAMLRLQLKQMLRENTELQQELSKLLPRPSGSSINVSGNRAIGGQHIGVANSGDHAHIVSNPSLSQSAYQEKMKDRERLRFELDSKQADLKRDRFFSVCLGSICFTILAVHFAASVSIWPWLFKAVAGAFLASCIMWPFTAIRLHMTTKRLSDLIKDGYSND